MSRASSSADSRASPSAPSRASERADFRGSAPAVGVVLLVLVTVVLAASVGSVVSDATLDRPPAATLSLSANATSQQVALTHEGGDTLHVSNLDVQIAVDGTALAEQPPVPFFAADGFRGGPTGPFNNESDGEWRAGETASVRIAGTNDPELESDSTVTVTVVSEGTVIFEGRVTAAS